MMTVDQFNTFLAGLEPWQARAVLVETVLPSRLVACGEPRHGENATRWSLMVLDGVARLGFAVRAVIIDPERVFDAEEEGLIREAVDVWPM